MRLTLQQEDHKRAGRPIRFRHLTQKQQQLICNGCGGKGSWIRAPGWTFTASCDHHDFNYWIGGTELDRVQADVQFYRAMRSDVTRMPWWRRPFARARAWIYYRAVRRFARDYFHYGTQRSWCDLEAMV